MKILFCFMSVTSCHNSSFDIFLLVTRSMYILIWSIITQPSNPNCLSDYIQIKKTAQISWPQLGVRARWQCVTITNSEQMLTFCQWCLDSAGFCHLHVVPSPNFVPCLRVKFIKLFVPSLNCSRSEVFQIWRSTVCIYFSIPCKYLI